jgi:hypothetical protein
MPASELGYGSPSLVGARLNSDLSRYCLRPVATLFSSRWIGPPSTRAIATRIHSVLYMFPNVNLPSRPHPARSPRPPGRGHEQRLALQPARRPGCAKRQLCSLACGRRRSEAAARTMGHVEQRDGLWCIVKRHGRRRGRRITRGLQLARLQRPSCAWNDSGKYGRLPHGARSHQRGAGRGDGQRTAGARTGCRHRRHETPAALLGCGPRRSEATVRTMGHVERPGGRWGVVEKC